VTVRLWRAFLLLIVAVSILILVRALRRPEGWRTPAPVRAGAALEPDVSPEGVAPDGRLEGNGAERYARALEVYEARRLPLRAQRRANRLPTEPRIGGEELGALIEGGKFRDTDLYDAGPRPAAFNVFPSGARWEFRRALDPMEMRPYMAAVVVLSQVALGEGMRRYRASRWGDAERIYVAVARFGRALRRRPGAFVDLQMGIEIELNAVHYLEVLARQTHSPGMESAAIRYGAAIRRLDLAVRARFASLSLPGPAIELLQHAAEPVWRVQAASALVQYLWLGRATGTESIAIRRAMQAARSDPSPWVRDAVARAMAAPESDYVDLTEDAPPAR